MANLGAFRDSVTIRLFCSRLLRKIFHVRLRKQTPVAVRRIKLRPTVA